LKELGSKLFSKEKTEGKKEKTIDNPNTSRVSKSVSTPTKDAKKEKSTPKLVSKESKKDPATSSTKPSESEPKCRPLTGKRNSLFALAISSKKDVSQSKDSIQSPTTLTWSKNSLATCSSGFSESSHSVASSKKLSMCSLVLPERPEFDELLEGNGGSQTAPADITQNPLERPSENRTLSKRPETASARSSRSAISIDSMKQKKLDKETWKSQLKDTVQKRMSIKYGDVATTILTEFSIGIEPAPVAPSQKIPWRKLMNTLWLGCLVKQAYKKTSAKMTVDSTTAVDTENKSLSYILKRLGMQPSTDYLSKVRDILTEFPEKRQVDLLERMLSSRIPDFAKLGIKERLHLCKIMSLDFHPQNTVLLWEEHKVTCFYYVLSGQIEVFKLNNGGKIRLSLMNPGTVFGHARVKVENATRSACAVMSMDTHVLCIDKDAYLKVF
jgi:hypothetical protein